MQSKWRAYFELLRFPAVFTAVADVMMGYLVTHGDLEPLSVFLLLAVASSCIYLAGMVLNDAYDSDVDAIERPERPIPSGRVSRATAVRVGWLLLGIGYTATWGIFVAHGFFGPAAVAGALVFFVYLYDRGISKTEVGPLVMGLCRALNVLLGMSTVEADVGQSPGTTLTPALLAILLGIWVYVAAVTWLAKSEIGSPTITSCVRYLLRGIIVIDAAIVLGFCGPYWGCVVLALLAPMLLLERWATTT